MKFRTGAICWLHELTLETELRGKSFCFSFEQPIFRAFGGDGKELIIQSKSEVKAQQAYELFIAALSLLDGHVIYSVNELPVVSKYSQSIAESENVHRFKNIVQFSRSGIYKAAEVSCKASFRKKHSISLYKYLFAVSQHSNYIIDLNPSHTGYTKLSRNPLDHLRYSYAILAFYSIIEELGLEVRASNKNPSKINGEWNPVIRADLEKRLSIAGVDLTKKVLWNLRGKPTKVHNPEKLKVSSKAPWASNYVRDSHMTLIDAIAYASWLRSKVVAHKLNESFTSISIYDVASINFLVRQILLDALGVKD